MAVFAPSSIWCGLAPNISQLIFARALQGIGAALLVPGSLAIISASFHHNERGRAIGTWSGFTSITAAVGPVLGGFLIEHGSWRWVFFLLMFLLSRWSGGLVDRYGAKPPLIIGPVVVALGFAMFAIPSVGGNYWTTYFPAVAVLGLGMSISVAPLTTTVMNSVSEERAGTASGINNAVSRLAGVLSIATLGVLMLASFNHHFSFRLSEIDLEPRIRHEIDEQHVKLAAIEIPPDVDSRLSADVQRAIDDSFVAGFRLVMFLGSGLAALSAVTAKLLIESKPKE